MESNLASPRSTNPEPYSMCSASAMEERCGCPRTISPDSSTWICVASSLWRNVRIAAAPLIVQLSFLCSSRLLVYPQTRASLFLMQGQKRTLESEGEVILSAAK